MKTVGWGGGGCEDYNTNFGIVGRVLPPAFMSINCSPFGTHARAKQPSLMMTEAHAYTRGRVAARE